MRSPNLPTGFALAVLLWVDTAHGADPFEAKPGNTSDSTTRALSPPPNQVKPPFIRILAPSLNDRALVSPIRIELTFGTASDARVSPDSFKIFYGLLKTDITAKMQPYAKITENGLLAEAAEIPSGNHRLFFQISDTAGRTTVREFIFSIDR